MIARTPDTVARPDSDLWFIFAEGRVTFGWGWVPPGPQWDRLQRVELRGEFGLDDRAPALFFGDRTVAVAVISGATWAGLEDKYKG